MGIPFRDRPQYNEIFQVLETNLNPTYPIVLRVMRVLPMSQSTLRKRLSSLLAEEIETYLPQFEPYKSDYQMVLFSCRDLEQWIESTWAVPGQERVYDKIEEFLAYEPKVFRVFLNFWVGRWLEKWRERVKVLSTKPKLPPVVLKRVKKARLIYREMEHRKELKKMVMQKLLGQGEICMVELIADNLIIEEIAKHVRGTNEDSGFIIVTAIDVFNSLSQRISRLHEEKGPLIYLNMKPYTF
jgi:hypothetical protein